MTAEKKKSGERKKKSDPTKKGVPIGNELLHVVDSVVKDKGIARAVLVEALESALLTAARKKMGSHRELEARFNEDLGEIELFEFKDVVDNVEDEFTQVSLEEGLRLDPEAEVGDSLGVKIDTESFGRIAAQTAKQVIIQKVRDAERLMVFTEYKDRKAEIITGIVRRFEKGNMVIDLGRAEGILPRSEQIPRENYRVGDRARAYILDIHSESKGPQIVLSRRSPEFVKKLFEMEVPEISEGIVRIQAVARDPGVRSKIAVQSSESSVDPVGACVGMKGSRVQAVVQELRGEKIDIIPWTVDIAKNVCNALAPAEVSRMIIDDEQQLVLVIVADDQLSLAIGRKGQNVRLASQLTGWNIDIKSETEMEKLTREAQDTLGQMPGIGPVLAEKLYLEGFTSVYDLARADLEVLSAIPGIGKVKAGKIMDAASGFFQDLLAAGEVDARGRPKKKPQDEATEPGSAEAAEASAAGEASPETSAPESDAAAAEPAKAQSAETAGLDSDHPPALDSSSNPDGESD
jgi:transcription termination/antitermination protein NusA